MLDPLSIATVPLLTSAPVFLGPYPALIAALTSKRMSQGLRSGGGWPTKPCFGASR